MDKEQLPDVYFDEDFAPHDVLPELEDDSDDDELDEE